MLSEKDGQKLNSTQREGHTKTILYSARKTDKEMKTVLSEKDRRKLNCTQRERQTKTKLYSARKTDKN